MAYIVKHLGQTKERKDCTYYRFGIEIIKSLEVFRKTRLRRHGCCRPCLSLRSSPIRRGGLAINTPFARFCN